MATNKQVINYASVKVVIFQMISEEKIKSEKDIMAVYEFVANELNIPLGKAQQVAGNIFNEFYKMVNNYSKNLDSKLKIA